jgi:lysophospholipase L1-like esterase
MHRNIVTSILIGIGASTSAHLGAADVPTRSDTSTAIGVQNKPPVIHMAALGDSITRAFNANGPVDHPWNSWATGNSDEIGLFRRGQVKSHAEYLSEKTGRDVIVYNVAKSGATSSDLVRQVEALKGRPMDYATILIGANDLCSHRDPPKPDGQADMTGYAPRVESAVAKLIATNPQIKILLVSIPDMLRLQRLGQGTACQTRWARFGICKMLLGPEATEASIAAFGAQWRAANEDLHLIAARYRDNVQFNPVLSEYPFERGHLSDIDCFHPNITGQNILSRETWNTGWWRH